MDTFVEESEGFQSSEEVIPETQIVGVGGQISADNEQVGSLDFDEHMAQLQQGRSRCRIRNPTLHVNSSAHATQQAIPQTCRSVESERSRRLGLRSSVP
jgi:hypothetical protein